MENNSEISPLSPHEMDEVKHRGVSIRFDCLITQFDLGQIKPKVTVASIDPEPLPPQWFKSECTFSMEFLNNTDPCIIGMEIKEAYRRLRQYIEQYEKVQ